MTPCVMNLTRVSIDMYQVSKHSSALYCKTALVVFFFPLCLSLSRCASRGMILTFGEYGLLDDLL